MASPLDMGYGQMLEFERTLIAAGLDGDDILEILRSPEKAKTWVAELKNLLWPPLFVSPGQQIQNVCQWWSDYFTVSELEVAEEEIAMLVRPIEPLQAWVLVPHFDSVEQTFDWLWNQVATTHVKHWRWPELKSDPEHLDLLGAIEFTPNCLTWELIDFGAHLYGRPDAVRDGGSAEFALLAAASHHPTWAASLGETVKGTFVPHVNLCGLQAKPQGRDSWAYVPGLDRDKKGLNLSAYPINNSDPVWACPVRLGGGS